MAKRPSFKQLKTGTILYRPTTGLGKGKYVVIENGEVLDKIAKMAGLTSKYLARDVAFAALDLYETVEGTLSEAVKKKVFVTVSPASDGSYLVEATVNTEPSVRRPKSRATVFIDKAGRIRRGTGYKTLREVPSITTYVAREMHIAFKKAVEKIRARATPRILEILRKAAHDAGLRWEPKVLRYRAPAGGIEVGGKFYKGGQFLPL